MKADGGWIWEASEIFCFFFFVCLMGCGESMFQSIVWHLEEVVAGKRSSRVDLSVCSGTPEELALAIEMAEKAEKAGTWELLNWWIHRLTWFRCMQCDSQRALGCHLSSFLVKGLKAPAFFKFKSTSDQRNRRRRAWKKLRCRYHLISTRSCFGSGWSWWKAAV